MTDPAAMTFGDETVVHIDRFGVWTMKPDDDRPELRYVPKADPVAPTPSDSAGVPDVDTLVETLREKADLFVRPGFRDEDGVWHDGPHRIEFDAALSDLAATARERDGMYAQLQEIQRIANETFARAEAAEADRDRLREELDIADGVIKELTDTAKYHSDRVAKLEAARDVAGELFALLATNQNDDSDYVYVLRSDVRRIEAEIDVLAGDGGGE